MPPPSCRESATASTNPDAEADAIAVSYENQFPGNSLSAAASAREPITAPMNIGSRQRT
jgi:hypothetical protein